MPGTLYLVATPIGNLEDITLRALRILKEVALIACEDTRQTAKLLHHFQIAQPTISYHQHNEKERSLQLLKRLEQGDSIALVSDAGTPVVSDPGYTLVQKAIEQNINVVPVPGASALLPALTASGLATDSFLFLGFLAPRASQRRKELKNLCQMPMTLVFYESPYRIEETLSDMLEIFGDRKAVVARELTKIHEEFIRNNLSTLQAKIKTTPPKGEIVLLVEGAKEASEPVSKSIGSMVEEVMQSKQLSKMDALKLVAKSLGISKSEAYRRLQEN
ncbi:MAG: 16S rRNA (cytidine(1402)-2'-O)-methyltransferase [Blastocatellia bacterium]|nr:16S rRNA (cytidine(1402)-2'-O)-methyltransferase [Blastocatellia bacterium]